MTVPLLPPVVTTAGIALFTLLVGLWKLFHEDGE